MVIVVGVISWATIGEAERERIKELATNLSFTCEHSLLDSLEEYHRKESFERTN